jgi:23S rRNA pseudouridine1911/1915/1917 synthase
VTRLLAHERPAVDRPPDVSEGAVLTVLRVPKEMAGMRVDVFVHSQLKDTSRTRSKRIVLAAARHLDGTRIKPNARVLADQLIALWRPPWDEVEVPHDIEILYEDEHLLVINKPAGLPVHPSARYFRNTVVKILGQRFPSSHLVLAHRLDRDTSGVLVLARTAAADRRIKAHFSARTGVEKTYLAITWGWPAEDEVRVDLPLERDPSSRLRVAMRVAAAGCGLQASTRVHVLERRERQGRRYALVQCDLETGRQHQIRVHLRAIGCPVLGDKLYGPDPELHARSSDGTLTEQDHSRLEMARHALHAWKMSFNHPITGARIDATAQLPEDMRLFLQTVAKSS